MSESKELTVDEAPSSQAQQQRARTDALVAAVEAKSAQLSTLLSDSGISFRRFVEVFRRALIQSPDLLKADAGSIIQACMNACTDGLLPDGREGAIVVRNVNVAPRGSPKRYVPKASWSPMFQGLLKIAYASGNFRSIQARVVYEGDEYHYTLGLNPEVTHVPTRRRAAQELPVVAAYAVAITKDGGVFFEPFEADDIAKVKAVSKATSGPWQSWESEMIRKGPLRRMWKFLPRNERMDRIVDHDDENYDLEQIETPAAPPRALTPGFSQPALSQGADLAMDVEAPDMDEHGEPLPAEPANEAPKSNVAAEPPREELQPAAEPAQPEPGQVEAAPWSTAFLDALSRANGWLAVKQALRTFRKTEAAGVIEFDAMACKLAWGRMEQLREQGKDKTDFATDPLLFECWLTGTEHTPEAVETNWSIVQKLRDFEKLEINVKGRIQHRVKAAVEPEAQ